MEACRYCGELFAGKEDRKLHERVVHTILSGLDDMEAQYKQMEKERDELAARLSRAENNEQIDVIVNMPEEHLRQWCADMLKFEHEAIKHADELAAQNERLREQLERVVGLNAR